MSRKGIEGSEIVVNVEGRARESSHRAAVVKVIHVHVSGLAAKKGKIRISIDDSSASHQERVSQCKFAAMTCPCSPARPEIFQQKHPSLQKSSLVPIQFMFKS